MVSKNSHLTELICRWYVFLFLTYYGLGKIAGMQFYRRGKLPEEVANITLETASAYDIAWTFMGYSFAYILFVGVLQIIGASLLLFNKTKLLGVLILIPILVNIIVFDAIFLDKKGAMVNATIYFLMLLLILFLNKNNVTRALRSLTSFEKKPVFKVKIVLCVVISIVIIFVIDQFLVGLAGR